MLAICPSSHTSKDFLLQQEVFWNLRLSHMSFQLSLFLLSQFPARWASYRFQCTGFSSHSASTTGVFAKLGFCCAWPLPHRSQDEVVSARLNLRNGTIASWQIDAETMETVTDFIFLGSKITADGDCSHEIKRRLCSLEEKL